MRYLHPPISPGHRPRSIRWMRDSRREYRRWIRGSPVRSQSGRNTPCSEAEERRSAGTTDPIGLALFQSGVAIDPLLDVFSGAISPDRANNGASQAYGSNMVMGFNTSSPAEFTKIQIVSKLGAGAQSAFVLVSTRTGAPGTGELPRSDPAWFSWHERRGPPQGGGPRSPHVSRRRWYSVSERG